MEDSGIHLDAIKELGAAPGSRVSVESDFFRGDPLLSSICRTGPEFGSSILEREAEVVYGFELDRVESSNNQNLKKHDGEFIQMTQELGSLFEDLDSGEDESKISCAESSVDENLSEHMDESIQMTAKLEDLYDLVLVGNSDGLSILRQKTDDVGESNIGSILNLDNKPLKKHEDESIPVKQECDGRSSILEGKTKDVGVSDISSAHSSNNDCCNNTEVKCKDYYTVSNGVNIPRTQTYSDIVKANNAVDKNNDEEDVLYTTEKTQDIDQSVINSLDLRIDKKKYKCDVCGGLFEQKCKLIAHVRIHTGEKPFKCGVCGASFRLNRFLTIHAKIHIAERPKPFGCAHCSKRFVDKAGRRKHEKIHTGEITCKCKVCGKGFLARSNCTTHERTHTGEKPFECHICGKHFTQNAKVVIHIRAEHTGALFLCNNCPKTFKYETSLKQHQSRHHLNINE